MNKSSNDEIGVFELKNLFRILWKRKWWILITFIVIITIGILISFLRTPQYMIQSTLRISNNYLYYNDRIYKFFPEESEDFWIFTTREGYDQETRALLEIESIIKSDSFLTELESYLSGKYSKKILRDIIDIEIFTKERSFEITIVYDKPEEVLIIMNSVIDLLAEVKNSELENIRLDLIDKTDQKIKDLKDEIDELSQLNNNSQDILIEKDIDAKIDDYIILKEIKEMLEDEELLTNRIEVLGQPESADIFELISLKRDLVFSFIAAIVLGIITAFIANFFDAAHHPL